MNALSIILSKVQLRGAQILAEHANEVVTERYYASKLTANLSLMKIKTE